MDFDTQEQVLNYLGKKNDRNLIRRMLNDGRLYKEDGRYYLPEKGGDVQLNHMNFSQAATILEQSDDIEKLKQELGEAKINEDYWKKQAEKYKRYCNYVIENTYNIVKPKLGNKMEDFDGFKVSILSSVRERMAKEERYDED